MTTKEEKFEEYYKTIENNINYMRISKRMIKEMWDKGFEDGDSYGYQCGFEDGERHGSDI